MESGLVRTFRHEGECPCWGASPDCRRDIPLPPSKGELLFQPYYSPSVSSQIAWHSRRKAACLARLWISRVHLWQTCVSRRGKNKGKFSPPPISYIPASLVPPASHPQ